jgi:hypothetical protein
MNLKDVKEGQTYVVELRWKGLELKFRDTLVINDYANGNLVFNTISIIVPDPNKWDDDRMFKTDFNLSMEKI